MYVNIDQILTKQGKTRYWLARQTGATYSAIKVLCDNNTRSIRFDMLEKICEALQCDPSDILIPEKSGKLKT